MKIYIAAMALCSLAGFATADSLEESYTKLKAAVEKKDPDAVKASAAATSKLARDAENAPKPTDADEVEHWKQSIEYGKEVEGYTEYALGFIAQQPGVEPAKVVELVDALIAQNPKSNYLNEGAASAYLVALGKTETGAKQKQAQMAGLAKIVKGRPDNTVALAALVEGGSTQYGERLVSAMKAKTKPEGVSEGDWEKQRSAAFALGYYTMGMAALGKQGWVDCDKNLKAAVPLLSGDQARLGNAYYGLGVCDFNFGKTVNDRVKMKEGEQYSEKSAAIKSPSQDQAYRNVAAMKQALAGK
jgi:hypothetical protein